MANADGEEPVSVNQWQDRFSALLAECGDREEASARLIAELDQKYHEWVTPKLAALASLSPRERCDSLVKMKKRIRTVSAAILNHLGIASARPDSVLTGSLEALTAEIKYADIRGTHEQRVAMLRIDEERRSRFAKLIAETGSGSDTDLLVRTELEPWHEEQLRSILGVEERN